MSSQSLGLLIGGLLPAVFFGFSNIFLKMGSERGIGTPVLIVVIGLAVIAVGLALFPFMPERNTSGAFYAFLTGLVWALAMAGVAVALQRYGVPVSKLTPLFNMNTLIAVVFALWLFSEWKDVKVPQLLIGSALIVVGGVLVARA